MSGGRLNFDVVIAGAGIVGAACARECALNGLTVAVVEAAHVAAGATGAAMGHIVVMNESDAQFELTAFSQRLWKQCSDQLPAACEYREAGTLWVAADEAELDEARQKAAYYSRRGLRATVLDERQMKELEPNLREGLAGGLLVSDDAIVFPPPAAAFFLKEAEGLGARVLTGRRAERMDDGGVLLDDGTVLEGGAVVNAAGSRAARLTSALPVTPRKGHLALTVSRPGFVRHQVVELGYLKSAHEMASESVAFNVQPRRNGQIVIGSSRQFGTEDPAVEENILARMMERAAAYMPGLQAMAMERAWTGFRAATPDKLPLIGLVPGFERVYAATGHEGLGITTSTGTARLLVDGLMGRDGEIAHEPYLPGRASAL